MAKIMKEETGMTGFRKTLSWTMRFSGFHEPWGGGAYLGRGVGPDLSTAGDVQRVVELLIHLVRTQPRLREPPGQLLNTGVQARRPSHPRVRPAPRNPEAAATTTPEEPLS